MNSEEVGKLWNGNAEAWSILSRKGYDIYRDYFNTPAFFEIMPDIKGLKGIDIGCGEGNNTRIARDLGADMTGIDIAETFIKFAEKKNEGNNKIKYIVGNAHNLPFPDKVFDFAMATMSFMDMPNPNIAIKEAYRVLKKGGFFQFSIMHPCFFTPQQEWVYDENNNRRGIICGDYFKKINGDVEEWSFSALPDEYKQKYDKFKVPRFTMTLSEWLNILIETGFTIEKLNEPYPSTEVVKKVPHLSDARIISYFLQIRVRKSL